MHKYLLYGKFARRRSSKSSVINGNIRKLFRKIRNKRLILYTSGELLDDIKKTFNFSKYNIVGISHESFIAAQNGIMNGLKIYSPEEIKHLDIERIILCSDSVKKDKEFLEDFILGKNSKIKIVPYPQKSLFKRFLDLFR